MYKINCIVCNYTSINLSLKKGMKKCPPKTAEATFGLRCATFWPPCATQNILTLMVPDELKKGLYIIFVLFWGACDPQAASWTSLD